MVLLCEDTQSRMFLEHVLAHRGYDRRSIRVVMAPPAAGSAEQFVRGQYATYVRFLRRHKATKAQVVHLDADPTYSVADRHKQLAEALAPHEGRTADDPIALLVPKRNIETWIHLLRGVSVDEETAYPKLSGREGSCGPEAVAFSTHASEGTWPAHRIPSMDAGLVELRRLPHGSSMR